MDDKKGKLLAKVSELKLRRGTKQKFMGQWLEIVFCKPDVFSVKINGRFIKFNGGRKGRGRVYYWKADVGYSEASFDVADVLQTIARLPKSEKGKIVKTKWRNC